MRFPLRKVGNSYIITIPRTVYTDEDLKRGYISLPFKGEEETVEPDEPAKDPYYYDED